VRSQTLRRRARAIVSPQAEHLSHARHRLALRVFAFRDAVHFKFTQHDINACRGFDRLEGRIDRTVAGRGALHHASVGVLKANERLRGDIHVRDRL